MHLILFSPYPFTAQFPYTSSFFTLLSPSLRPSLRNPFSLFPFLLSLILFKCPLFCSRIAAYACAYRLCGNVNNSISKHYYAQIVWVKKKVCMYVLMVIILTQIIA